MKIHWEQVAAGYESIEIQDAFEEITLHFMEQAIDDYKQLGNE
ncbi:hypothetical protein [Corynebacterium diphtheriae]|nr:hypothetical protein [Corynebacterium diphtheriae]UWE89153.1 hypothetical protein NY054_03645 [Corynebacterium diphtheriae bv. mitis]